MQRVATVGILLDQFASYAKVFLVDLVRALGLADCNAVMIWDWMFSRAGADMGSWRFPNIPHVYRFVHLAQRLRVIGLRLA